MGREKGSFIVRIKDFLVKKIYNRIAYSFKCLFSPKGRTLLLFIIALIYILSLKSLVLWFSPYLSSLPELPEHFLALLLSSPILFIIWYFRDENKRDEIENTRKNTNLKEFQQLQQWAMGNISHDGNMSKKEAKQTALSLQIASLHQLRDYLKGVYGDNFKRASFEIFRSVLGGQCIERF